MDRAGLIGKTGSKKKNGTPYFPDKIIINILSCLPAKTVMRCRVVCKKWRDITSARDFIEVHSRNTIPSILVSKHSRHSGLDFFALDNCWETRLKTHRFHHYSTKFPETGRVLLSHSGLLVLLEDMSLPGRPNFIILNPTRPRHEHVRIILSEKMWRSQILGVYFHPVLEEYYSLLILEGNQTQYKLLSLGSNPSFKTISCPFSNRIENHDANPLFINNCLYWLIQPEHYHKQRVRGRYDIMRFDILTEGINLIHCPLPMNIDCTYDHARLLNSDGIVSYVLIYPGKISIWRLEDHTEQLWTTAEYNFSLDFDPHFTVVDGKLAFLNRRRLILCNLMDGTVKKHPTNKMYRHCCLKLSHQMSLATLKNCIPTISIDENLKLVVSDYRTPFAGNIVRRRRRI